MNTHEFQAKQILQKYQLPMPPFEVAASLADVEHILKKTGWTAAVIKVQVHAGGRGKAGGVKIGKTPQEILQIAQDLIGKKIINAQTGREGMVAQQVLISPLVDIQQEYYLALTISRERAQPILIASPVGGVDIEQVAHETPDQVLMMPIPTNGLLRRYQEMNVNQVMGWSEAIAKQGHQLIKTLIQVFNETDAYLLEINPLVKTTTNELLILDTKLVVDECALFRQPLLRSFFDPTQIPQQEVRAQAQELAYIALEGTIGCLVNGAGLAMATMDLIHYYGGKPANFLDVGGGASKEKITEGFKIILDDPQVKAIFVNIFGGIMNCELLALGIIAAAKELSIPVPLVVRMEGTNVEQGRTLLKQSQLNIYMIDDLTEAAKRVVQLSQTGK
jgi:succinyl-CoA synthetase beta subunit